MEASHIIARGTGVELQDRLRGHWLPPSQKSEHQSGVCWRPKVLVPCPMACSLGIGQQLCNLPPPVLRDGARELDIKVDDHVPFLARLLGDGHPLQDAAKGVADHSLQASSNGACAARIPSLRLVLPGVTGRSRWPQRKQLLALSMPCKVQPFAWQPPVTPAASLKRPFTCVRHSPKWYQGGVAPVPQCATGTTSAACVKDLQPEPTSAGKQAMIIRRAPCSGAQSSQGEVPCTMRHLPLQGCASRSQGAQSQSAARAECGRLGA